MKTKVFLFVCASIIFSFSCNKASPCDSDNENKGDIINSVLLGSCFNDFENKSFVIRTQAELDSVYFLSEQNGHTCSRPEIDFIKYSLLAHVTKGQCDIQIIREIQIDSQQKKYFYAIHVTECGNCNSEIFSINGVLTPRIPEGWTVQFIQE